MKKHPVFFILIIMFGNIINAVEPKNSDMSVNCKVDGDQYVVTVANVSAETLFYWLIPDNPKSPFSKVPIGAELFIMDSAGQSARGISSLSLVSEAVKLPVKMVQLKPGQVNKYHFMTAALWNGVLPAGLATLKEKKVRYMVKLKVYKSCSLNDFILVESPWCEF